jgi:hypothetical protein
MVELERASSIAASYQFTHISLDLGKNKQELHLNNTALGSTGIEWSVVLPKIKKSYDAVRLKSGYRVFLLC